jgi:tetrahydromethanopterin S-methyltransferase subunit G
MAHLLQNELKLTVVIFRLLQLVDKKIQNQIGLLHGFPQSLFMLPISVPVKASGQLSEKQQRK